MIHFPQLVSGATVQYPYRRRTSWRTLVNDLPGGDRIVARSEDGRTITWEVRLTDLNPLEAGQIVDLFEQAEGRLKPFRFMDPGSNLLAWTDDFSKPCWIV